jgi:hypothetical protein
VSCCCLPARLQLALNLSKTAAELPQLLRLLSAHLQLLPLQQVVQPI